MYTTVNPQGLFSQTHSALQDLYIVTGVVVLHTFNEPLPFPIIQNVNP